eukprot:6833549-Prymnesium_polylepis.2
MLAQAAISTRRFRARTRHRNRSEPHKRPAPVPCKPGACRAPAAAALENDVRHLVDDHRWPRQNYAAKSIDDLRARVTGSKGQHRAAGCRRSSRSQVHAANTGCRFEESRSGLCWCGAAHLTTSPYARRQPRGRLDTATSLRVAWPLRPAGTTACHAFYYMRNGLSPGTGASHIILDFAIPGVWCVERRGKELWHN